MQWFSELGVPPAGNTDPVQRGMWERPADAGSISERGKAAAALAMAKSLQQMMVDRGLKEEVRDGWLGGWLKRGMNASGLSLPAVHI